MGFLGKPEFISQLEIKEGVFSLLDFHRYQDNLIKYLDEKKLKRVFEKGVVSNRGKAKWEEVIFETAQKFYFQVNTINVNGEDEFGLTIYYKPEQFNELIFLTTQLLKPFKDGTDNNGTTQTENK
jgi:hypothetical protein